MPRTTNQEFIKTHHRLKRYWIYAKADPYGYLKAQEQWALHDYFQPTKTMTNSQLRRHRALITAKRPSLPQQAGRALVKIDSAAVAWAMAEARRVGMPVPLATKGGTKQTLQFVVHGVVHPELDLPALAELLVEIAQGDMTGSPRGVVEDHLHGISYPDPDEPSGAS